jgi:hypothetical protein
MEWFKSVSQGRFLIARGRPGRRHHPGKPQFFEELNLKGELFYAACQNNREAS